MDPRGDKKVIPQKEGHIGTYWGIFLDFDFFVVPEGILGTGGNFV